MSSSEEGMKNLLKTVEEFCKFSGMELAPKKCKSLSYTYSDRTRNTININFKINNEIIPQISLFSYIEYLGIPIACNRAIKKKHSRLIINEIKNQITKIMESPLKITQKIDCIKRLITPKFDYILLNSVCPLNELKNIDSYIRGWINKLCKSKGIPINYFYTNWKDGGLGMKNLYERYQILTIRNYIAMKYSKDIIIKKFINQMEKDEIDYRGLIKDEESPFLNFRFDNQNNLIQNRRNKENCLFIRTLKSLSNLQLILIIDEEDESIKLGDLKEEIIEQNVESEKILKQLNQLFCDRHRKALISSDFKGHSFNTLINSKTSNYFFTQCKYPISDTLARFTILSRTNNLSTGEILHKNKPGIFDGKCHRCHRNLNDSLMHRLNGCHIIKNWFIPRHNAILKEVIKSIQEKDRENKLIINFDKPIRKNHLRLPERTNRLKPDAWFFSDDTLNIIEVNSPYGSLKDTNEGKISSLTIRRKEKLEKYKDLVEDCNNTFNCNTNLYVIVVSSLGAIPKETYKDIKALLHNDKYKAKLTSKRCSMVALRESFKIYRKWSTYNIRDNLINDEDTIAQIQEEIEQNGDTDDEDDFNGDNSENNNNEEDSIVEHEEYNIEDEDLEEIFETSEENQEDQEENDTHRTHSNTLGHGVESESIESNEESL